MTEKSNTSTSPETPPKHMPTAAKDKVPVKEKIMYGAGSGSFQIASDGVNQLVNPIFNMTLGLSPAIIGLVLAIVRMVDAFTDPIMGKISDNTRSRFGRRRPYIFVGSFLTAFSFVLLWQVPETWGMTGITIFFLSAMILFSLCGTVQNVPYHTLGLEMTADYHERTSVAGYKMMFSFSFTLAIPWLFRIAQSDRFDSVMDGMRFTSWGVAALILFGGVLPALFVRERYYSIAQKQKKIPFWRNMKLTMSNRPFLLVMGIILATGACSGIVSALGSYVIFYHMYLGDLKAGATQFALASNIWCVVAFISVPIITMASKRFGKLHTLRFLLVLGIVGAISKFFCYSRANPDLLFVTQLIIAPMGAGFWVLIGSMQADVCDDDEFNNGVRREGVFGAVGSWLMKVAGALAVLISGFILVGTGFDIDLKGDQAEATLMNMRILFSVVPILFGFVALFLLSRYPLNEKRMAEIRTELELRRDSIV